MSPRSSLNSIKYACGRKTGSSYVMQHIKSRDFAGEVNFEFFIWCIRALSFIKIDQGIQILQLKKDQKFSLFSLLFLNVSIYVYQRKPQIPFDVLYQIWESKYFHVEIKYSNIDMFVSLQIVGSHNKLGNSSRKVDQLPFDISHFKLLKHLQVSNPHESYLLIGVKEGDNIYWTNQIHC